MRFYHKSSRFRQPRNSETSESEIEAATKNTKRIRKFIPKLHRPKFLKSKKESKAKTTDNVDAKSSPSVLKKFDKGLQNFQQKMNKLEVPKLQETLKRNSWGSLPKLNSKRSMSVNDINLQQNSKVPKTFFQRSKISAFSQNMKGSLPRSLSSMLQPMSAASADAAAFDNVRYKVGQSSFYVLSDCGPGGSSCLPSPLPTTRKGILFLF